MLFKLQFRNSRGINRNMAIKNNNKKGQFSAVEILLMIIMFATVATFFGNNPLSTSNDFKYSVESSINSIYQSNNYRNSIIDENLSTDTNSQNWSSLENLLNKKYNSYKVKILNKTSKKTILDKCNQTYNNKLISEKIVSTTGNDKYEFRRIRLEVCS